MRRGLRCCILAIPLVGACASDGVSGIPAAAGMSANAGTAALGSVAGSGGAAGAGGMSSETGAGASSAGSSALAGNPAGGGPSTGGGGSSGSAAAGSAGAGAAGSAGTAGSGDCAGNAISLSANGTGSASDAAQARVAIDLMSDLPIGNAKRTVEFWAYIKSTDWLGEKNELYFYGGAGTNSTFGLDFGTNTVMAMPDNHATFNPFTGGGVTVDSTDYLGVSSSADQWLHVAMTWDGSALKLYVNGELKIDKSGNTMLATGNSLLTLGCNPQNNNCFNGSFDELRIWNVDRSPADLKANYARSLVGNEAGLVGYWKFDESPGASSAADSVSSAGHAAHPGALLATSSEQKPTFVTANPPAPIHCP